MKPYLIGLAGGSASGKTSIVHALKEAFGKYVTVLYFDDYYKDLSHLPFEARTKINFDHPDAFDLDLLAEHVKALKEGKAIVKPIYDFKAHNRSNQTEYLVPSEIVLLDGLFTLAIEEVAQYCDLKLYVETPADIRFIRPMHELFVEPSKYKADLIVLHGVENKAAMDVIISKIVSKLDQEKMPKAVLK